MKSLGSTLFILGVLAFGLNYMNAVPKVLAWIYEWGEDTAMWIKAGRDLCKIPQNPLNSY
nr:hypothetical protein [uncultured Neisseria sp.]